MDQYRNDIKDILGTVNRQTVSAKQVRQLLEEKKKVDLSSNKKDLNALILQCFDETASPQGGDGAETKPAKKSRGSKSTEEGGAEGGKPAKKTRKRKGAEEGEEGQKKKRNVDPANNPLNKPMQLDPKLAEFLGVEQMSRPQTVKKLWEYIKANNLQDPNDKRTILCDDKMKHVFAVDSLHMFTMNKYLTSLMTKIPDDKLPKQPSPAEAAGEKAEETEKTEHTEQPKEESKPEASPEEEEEKDE
ncbi:RNA polymerase I upstream activation factor complex subunit Spp27 [Schizosaccharomyces cryophilus OY26]|uniref:RNA polymerase I upstream activation factor complex subunit Spp27 n=1 Tax=Schizosaccharomyces cryophilus (strain OY26 / ATCC MYA-4695 / CBS 11777 / NBRC 106824 / NRRL Y48691) TaxID=653667 RepID=S9VUB8_SCHCR|nr:RNA polymerase I upstream activation factor complex subunit Spp27 [Schizosaccharomyces cryophilus OY26]EPY51368.1 RNA polymerase I upstream activation factor complex subunit Spp27 [Schizosaccharomyces cryophilus OY26]